jgi:hypothetical protein
VGAILDGKAFSQLSPGKQVMKGRGTILGFMQIQMWLEFLG